MQHHRVLSTRRVLRSIAALVALLLLGAVLAACGSDEDDASPAADDHFDKTKFSRNDPAPDFTLPTADGGTVSLSEYTSAGQPVLLFFHMADG